MNSAKQQGTRLTFRNHRNNEILEKEYKNKIPFKIAPPKNQIPGNTSDQGGERLMCSEL